MVLAPLAALPLGLAVAGVVLAGHWLGLPPLVTALLAIGAAILGNRAFHLDGLSDTVDGLAASYDRARSLEVMKSGTSGPAGVVAVVLVLGLQVAGLASLVSSSWSGGVLARRRGLRVPRGARGLLRARGATGATRRARAAPTPRPCRGSWPSSTWTLARRRPCPGRRVGRARRGGAEPSPLRSPWWSSWSWSPARTRRFGGVTGDVFGACIELSLAALLVALA